MSTNVHPDAYTDWLIMLYQVLAKVRKEGLMSIEADVEQPDRERSVFATMPQIMTAPYFEFATDILRLAIGGNLNAAEVQVYVDHAIAGYVEAGVADPHLLKTIWLTLWASMCGYAPQVAIEFGRQAIPVAHKPDFATLEKKCKEARDQQRAREQQAEKPPTLDEAIDRFIASIGGQVDTREE